MKPDLAVSSTRIETCTKVNPTREEIEAHLNEGWEVKFEQVLMRDSQILHFMRFERVAEVVTKPVVESVEVVINPVITEPSPVKAIMRIPSTAENPLNIFGVHGRFIRENGLSAWKNAMDEMSAMAFQHAMAGGVRRRQFPATIGGVQ
jgi:hypothetical protein